jgi:L-iditol 2-dehydrogenase
MKAAVLHAIGDIRCEDVPIPEIGPGEVLIRVRAAGICGSDIPRVMVTGTYHFPIIPGHEFAGEIARIGKEVDDVNPGDRVVVIPCIPCRKCKYCQRGDFFHCLNYNYLGSRADGGFAEYVKAPSENLVFLPEGVDFEEGASTEPVSVALHMIKRAKGIHPGDWVCVFGAGAIGIFCAQWAKSLGAEKVFIVDIAHQRLDTAKKIGLKRCINAATQDSVEYILDRTEREGVDLCMEVAGTNITLEQCLKIARRKGRVSLVGRIGQKLCISEESMSSILRKELTIFGGWGFEFVNFPHHAWRTSLNSMREGKIQTKPLITHRFSLQETSKVFKMMYEKEQYFHKVMFIP